jgi:hypothetical protein
MSESEWAAFCYDGSDAWWDGYRDRMRCGSAVLEGYAPSCLIPAEYDESWLRGARYRDIEEKNLAIAKRS